MAWVILGCYSVSPSLSYVYRRYPCYQIYVCFSLVNVFFFFIVGDSTKNPERQGKLFFLPYICMPKQYFDYVFLFLSFPEYCLIQVSAHYSPWASWQVFKKVLLDTTMCIQSHISFGCFGTTANATQVFAIYTIWTSYLKYLFKIWIFKKIVAYLL